MAATDNPATLAPRACQAARSCRAPRRETAVASAISVAPSCPPPVLAVLPIPFGNAGRRRHAHQLPPAVMMATHRQRTPTTPAECPDTGSSVILHAFAQRRSASGNPRLDRANRTIERHGNLFVTHVLDVAQHQHLAKFARKFTHSAAQ